EYNELVNSPRRERQRMFAAGPATNIFAALILMALLGQVAGQFVSETDGVHSSAIIVDQPAEEAGLLAFDVIVAINGSEISDEQDFIDVMEDINSGQIVDMEVVRYETGETEILTVNMTDKYQYYIELGWDPETLESIGVEEGDAFLGVSNLAGGTAGVERLAGWAHPDFESNPLGYIIAVPVGTVNILITPFQNQGVAIHPAQEEMLSAGDGFLAETIGLSGLLFLVNLFFWLIWVNILLGFTNLIPMIPFDGGHLFKDIVNGVMNGVRKLGKKTGLYNLHPLWVDHVTRRASSLSSMMLLFALVFIMFAPYL
ncbi:MAG: M50 family metallopeptidase, partial [Euryarchaeota archaeon]